ncbi:MAG: ABC transporter permease [Eubacterium sp.]|nr:ABC transporter permease [Eubacterium sp.]
MDRLKQQSNFQLKNYYIFMLLIVLCVGFGLLSPQFFTVSNWSNLLLVQATTGVMALGAIFVLILGEFDVSLGYLISFCMMTGAVLAERGASGVVVLIVMVAVGALCGLASGLLTVKAKVSSFIATLGMGILLYGLNLAISNGEVHSGSVPGLLTTIGQAKWGGIGICFWVLLVLCAVIYLMLNHTVIGRNLYAVGGSEKISFLAGVKTNRIRILAFVLSGAFTGVGAVFQLGQAGAANPSSGPNLLMPTYAIVFLSATAFQVGTYNVPGLLLSIIILGVGINGLNLMGAPSWVEFVYNGGVLVLAVFLSQLDRYTAVGGRMRRMQKSAGNSKK